MIHTPISSMHHSIGFISYLCLLFLIHFKHDVLLFSFFLELFIFFLPIIKILMNLVSKMTISWFLITFSIDECVNSRPSENLFFLLLIWFIDWNVSILTIRNFVKLERAHLMQKVILFIIFSFWRRHQIWVSSIFYSLKLVRNLLW